jgi:integrase
MADVIDRLTGTDLSTGRLVALRSAARTFCRALGKDPANISAEPRAVREALARLTPGATGLSRQSFLNLRSLLGKALDAAGIATIAVRCRMALTPAWSALLGGVGDCGMRYALARPLKLLSSVGIEPHDIDQSQVDSLFLAIEARQVLRWPRLAHRAFVRHWNRARRSVQGWPQLELRIDDRRDRYVLSAEIFLPALRIDITDWLHSVSSFSLTRRRPPLRPRTVDGHRLLLWELASAAVHAGVPVAVLSSLRALVDAAVVERALDWLAGRFGNRPAPHLASIARLACTVARRFVDEAADADRHKEERNLRELRLFCTNLQPTSDGMTPKNRELLNRFKDPDLIARFVTLPQQLFAPLAGKQRPTCADARGAAVAVAIEILLHAPIRIQNLHSIRLDTHYKVYGHGPKARVMLEFPASEVKNGIDLSYPLPPSTAAMIDLFCKQFRPLLAAPATPFLFPGRGRRPKQATGLSKEIAEVTAAVAGVRVTAHQFRHVCALLYLQRHPGDYETVRRFLGHSRIETTIRHYAGMEGEAAVALWDDTLGDIQKAAVERLRARHRRRRT